MSRLGADVEGLVALAAQMAATAGEVEEASNRLQRVLRSSYWQGRDAEDFQMQWRGHSVALRRAAAGLSSRSAELNREAKEQVAASETDGLGASSITPAAASRAGNEVDELSPRDIAAGAVAPTGIKEWSGDARVSVEFLALSGGLSARIEDYPGPHSLLTVGSKIGAHLSVGAGEGFLIDLGDTEVGHMAAASVSAGIEGGESRSWVVRDSQAESALVERGIEHLAATSTEGISQYNAILGGVAGFLADRVLDPPIPDITTTYAGLVVSGSALASMGFGSVQGRGKLSGVLATHEVRKGQRWYSLTLEGAGAGGLSAGLLGLDPKDTSLSGTARSVVSMGTPSNGRIPVLLQHYREANGDIVSESRSLVLSQQRLKGGIDDVIAELVQGDIVGAARDLSSAVVDVQGSQTRTGAVTSGDAGIRASAGVAGLGISGTQRSLEFD